MIGNIDFWGQPARAAPQQSVPTTPHPHNRLTEPTLHIAVVVALAL